MGCRVMRRPSKLPPYVQAFVDRFGHSRYYFRKPGCPRVALPGLPWSKEFMAAHETAMNQKLEIGATRTIPGTLDALIASYYRSSDFLGLRPITQSTYRNIIERIRKEHGDKPVAMLARDHIKRIMGKFSDKPDAGNRWLKMFRVLMRHAVESGYRKDNPTIGIRRMKTSTYGFRTWTEEEIAKFYAKFEIGTRERLAFDLLLYSGQRRGDVVTMGRQHVRNGSLVIRQSKTGTEVDIPIAATLKASLDLVPAGQLVFLMTQQGKPFTAAGFTNWFRDAVAAAGLPLGLSAHGLRKAACRRLAEAGCSAPQLMAISGHKTLAEAQKYIETANRKALAEEGMEKVHAFMAKEKSGTKGVKPSPKV